MRPLEELKKILDGFGIQYVVAVDEPHAGRPISAKVAQLMNDCTAGIFVFTKDELFFRKQKSGEIDEVWRPSENVIYELGAAGIMEKVSAENPHFYSEFAASRFLRPDFHGTDPSLWEDVDDVARFRRDIS